jgi:hypothetical protein
MGFEERQKAFNKELLELCEKYNIEFEHTGEPLFDDGAFAGLEEEDVCFKDKDSGIEVHLAYKI